MILALLVMLAAFGLLLALLKAGSDDDDRFGRD
jgi:hypothetical protein